MEIRGGATVVGPLVAEGGTPLSSFGAT
jgi:hypothetical protein